MRSATTLAAGFPKVTRRVCWVCFSSEVEGRLSSSVQLPTKYGGVYTVSSTWHVAKENRTDTVLQVTLIPGDGIGAEITDSVKEVFEHVNAPIEWEQYDVSGETPGGEEVFKQALESLKRNRVGLKGASATCK